MLSIPSICTFATGAGVVAETAAAHAVGVRLVRMERPDPVEARVCADLLHRLGFVVVDVRGAAGVPPPAVAIPRRHVAVITGPDAQERRVAARWVRRLSHESPRGHLVLIAGPPVRESGGGTATQARELTAAGLPAVIRPFALAAGDLRLARAERYTRRRRLAAGSRWARATMAAAHRRGDEHGMVAAAGRVVDLLIVQGDVARAVETARRLCAAVTAFPAAAVAASLLGHARLLSLDLDPAEAVLAGAAAEAALLEQPVPERLACAWRDVCVWRGRFEEAIAVARMAPGHAPADVGGAALAAWAVRDGDLLRTCRARLEQAAAAGEPHARFWAAIAGALALAVAEPAELAALAPRAAEALARAAPRGGRALAHAVAIEVLLRAGADPRRHRAAAGAAPLHALLSDWMTACAAGDDAAMARTAARARHAGVDGLTRWGTREPRMQLVHDWPTLLHLIHDADDELGALTSGCAWVRRQGRATAVAVVDAAGTSWLASDGWTRDDLARPDVQRLLAAPPPATMADGAALFASASIRYAGRTIGRVLARGTVDGRATLEQAVAAFAAVASPAVRARLDTLAVGRAAHVLLPDIIGQSAAVSALRDEIARAASTIFPVLIEGESGTGKELVARALHRLGPRRDRRFCAVNCAAFTDELFEAELFGYARGAFTGAVGARAGLIEDAHEGTLFLDEVGDLSARAQAKLLRTLQEREIRRLGENAARAVDVRVVAATNVPLADAVGQGRFRADLLFRLAVVRIRVPPLRDRAEDIPLIARAVWRRLSDEAGKRVALGPDAIAALCRHRWPGNIRELQNVLAALVVLAPGRGRVGGRHVSQVLQSEAPADEAAGLSLDDGRRLFERRMIVAALARHGGRRAPAAHELGLTRQGLAKAMRRLDLDLAGDQAGVA